MKNENSVTLSLEDVAALMSAKDLSSDTVDIGDDEGGDSAKDFFEGLFSSLLKYWWLIVISTLVFAAGAFAFLYVTGEPAFTATVNMFARSSAETDEAKDALNLTEMANPEVYIKPYSLYLKMNMTLDSIIDKLEERHGDKYADLTREQLHGMISCGSRDGTNIFYVTITDADPQRAVDIANIIREELPDKLKDAHNMTDSPVTPVDWPTSVNDAVEVADHLILKTFVAAIVGCLLACIYAYIKGCVLDDSIESANWLREQFKDVPILAEIPEIVPSRESEHTSEKE